MSPNLAPNKFLAHLECKKTFQRQGIRPPGPCWGDTALPPDLLAGGKGKGWAGCPSSITLPPLPAIWGSGFGPLVVDSMMSWIRICNH